jgi:hypothetical protein
MSGSDRRVALAELHASKVKLRVDANVVDGIDRFLGEHYGISDPLAFPEVERRLIAAASTDPHARRLLRALHERNAVHSEERDTANADARFYDLMAVMPYSGWIHSTKRAYILDAAAAVTALCQRLRISGPILDVGCHVGYHTTWLRSHCCLDATGIDLGRRQIALASKLSVSICGTASFVVGEFVDLIPLRAFEMIISIDGPMWFTRYEPQIDAFFSRCLEMNGVFLVVGEELVPTASASAIAKRYGLELMLSDVVGGWLGDRFEGNPLLVFMKNDAPKEPPPDIDCFDAAWNTDFKNFCNQPATLRRNKTQAVFRATQQTF